jgi:hypothetical protein
VGLSEVIARSSSRRLAAISTAVGELYLWTFRRRVDQLHKVDLPDFKESTVVDLLRFAIKEIEEKLLQGFAMSSRLGRERTANGFRDAVNLEGNHD